MSRRPWPQTCDSRIDSAALSGSTSEVSRESQIMLVTMSHN